MNKMKNPEMEVVRFEAEDILTTSGVLMTASYSITPYPVGEQLTGRKGIITFSDGNNNRLGDLGFNNEGDTGTNGGWQYASGLDGAMWRPTNNDEGAAKLIGEAGVEVTGGPSNVIGGQNVFNWFYTGVSGLGGFNEGSESRVFSWDGTSWSN